MSVSGTLKQQWDEYRIAKQYGNQGESLEAASATRILVCPRSRCKSPLKYDPRTLGFRCSSEKCGYREGAALDKFIKPFIAPPAGCDYWVVTVRPPFWFYINEFRP